MSSLCASTAVCKTHPLRGSVSLYDKSEQTIKKGFYISIFSSPPVTYASSSPRNITFSEPEESDQLFSDNSQDDESFRADTHNTDTLLNAMFTVVKTRNGSVLTRNTILKMDHFSSATNTNLDFHLQGAPNFRKAELNVYGVAQPTSIGLSTILAIMNCHPKSVKSASCTWFSTREEPLIYLNGCPYVLRDDANPSQTMSTFLGINAARLEKVEERLKHDVLNESKKMDGLLLVHDELPDGTIVPCYIAADEVQTPKEVFQAFQEKGYRLKYFRIPISPEQAPEDNYFDEYVNIIKSLEPTDPLIFNCGMGVVRTTVGIIIAQILRRTQLIARGLPDPFPIAGWKYPSSKSSEIVRGLEEAGKNRTLLRLVYVLEKALGSKMAPHSAIEWALDRGEVVESLKEAITGNYQSIVSLTSVLDSGAFSKRMLDEIIDRSDTVINLRESILTNRIRQTTSNDLNDMFLEKASGDLQRYFFLLCFTAYINESADTRFKIRFSSWVKTRTETWTMLQNMRRKGPRLYYFRPVEDLSSLIHHKNSRNINRSIAVQKRTLSTYQDSVSHPVANETHDLIVKTRGGVALRSQTILKVDFWHHNYLCDERDPSQGKRALVHASPYYTPGMTPSGNPQPNTYAIEGASNFRRIQNTHVYGVAQPTIEGLRQVIRRLLTDRPRNDKVLWINLREEPVIYINGIPYVLRDQYYAFRNIRAYKGITGARLEQLEDRLKEDVIREVLNYDGRILLHNENGEGHMCARWEKVDVENVVTMRDVMNRVGSELAEELAEDDASEAVLVDYHRVPITAEKVPEWRSLDVLRDLITKVDLSKTAIILNCQVGYGRSTTGTAIATLLTRWLRPNTLGNPQEGVMKSQRLNYQIINSLLRVIHRGLENKLIVDYTLDQCAYTVNLRDIIEAAHLQAENEVHDQDNRKRIIKRGIVALERYFLLICFQAYLDSMAPGETEMAETFEQWMNRHAELGSILCELRSEEMELIVAVEKSLEGDGVALSSEVMRVVNARCGQVLAQQTILKHDAFPGCQNTNLTENIPGVYNYRRIEVQEIKNCIKNGGLTAQLSGLLADKQRNANDDRVAPFICGCAMPSKDAVRAVLNAMDAGPGGKRRVQWTCLREEPVLYVNKRPYVLRLFSDPIKNLETTGIARERVEDMEERMRRDALEEIKCYDGRMLLHDEELTNDGYVLVPVWETVPSECVETPSQVFQSIVDEGYQVDYLRVPITDEQAPIPDVFDQLIRRMQEANAGVDVLFNCQMGRGRTSTGMVMACLMSMILNNEAVSRMKESFTVESLDLTEKESSQLDEKDRYLRGDYRVVLQLVSVLTYGKLAKRLTDQAIDMCDHMQNLRKAIYEYKLRLEAIPDQNSKQWGAMRKVALSYLVRYFYLIVFANYLLEEMGHTDTMSRSDSSVSDSISSNAQPRDNAIGDQQASKMPTFRVWLKGRREITNIVKLQTLYLC
ncbi:inositol hexakisphosphate-domain-containing protein [Radiomyces spectabilis]|uniref:inositol hexakisphosphate-domain-containing protein n=1 Tax=Radiomyces spectabilis TaxID=64574 RepID=UPI00221F789A|nr:inositol hexakisphosphate-domain-containing protein [Radiomyces spectabilis]KAI8371352.1 inositol hexakisphosphate-domain-containing protein [Radiomyces spectabilis]